MEIGLSLSLTSNKGVGFLPAFMAAQSDGFDYRFVPPDGLFQESTGPTPAATANDVIGLALDQRLWSGQTLAQVIAAAPEMVGNGDFSGSTGWTLGGSSTISGGNLNIAFAAVPASRTTAASLIKSRTYFSEFKLDALALGPSSALTVRLGGGSATNLGLSHTTTGVKSEFIYTTNLIDQSIVDFTGRGGSPTITLGTIDYFSVKEVSRYAATQATGSFKPTVQAGGAKGDATDDRLALGFASASGDAFNVYPAATIPATLAATQVFAGAMDASANGDYLAVTTGGALRAKVGATTLDSTGIDLRGGTHDVAYWTDGATLYLYADGAIVASGAWAGSRPTTAWNLFALNNNGTPSNFTGATMTAALRGTQALTVSLANQICRAA